MNKGTREAILAELKAAQDIAAAAEAAARDLTDEERGRIGAHLGKARELQRTAEEAEALRKSLADFTDGIGGPPDTPPSDTPPGGGLKRGASIGEAFVKSAEFKALLASVPDGRFSEKSHVQSQPYGIKSLITGLADSSAGALVETQTLGLTPQTGLLTRPLTIRQLFSSGTTTSDAIEFVRVLSQTNNAAPVAEATSSALIGDGTGGTATPVQGGVKPESGMTFEKVLTNVKTIAHWIPATKRALSDAAQIRSLIDTFLRYGLEEEFEDQLLTGNGTGENFLGLNNTSGIQTEAAPVAPKDNFNALRNAKRKVVTGGRATPTAYVLNPADWADIETARTAEGVFLGGGPFASTPGTVWGLPVVESEAVPAKTAWCADWRMGMVWDREQASITVTDSHNDYFIRNLIAILAEMRAAFGVFRPASFVKITLA